jgi:hypothetical protein
MKENKSLFCTNRSTNYVGENSVESMTFLVPVNYSNIDFHTCNTIITFMDLNITKSLLPYKNDYNGYVVFTLPINSEITKTSGKHIFKLEFFDGELKMVTDENYIEVI